MDDIVLVNDSGYEISTLEELFSYIIDYFDYNSVSYDDAEKYVYELLYENDIVEDENFKIESLKDGYRILKKLESGYWHIVR